MICKLCSHIKEGQPYKYYCSKQENQRSYNKLQPISPTQEICEKFIENPNFTGKIDGRGYKRTKLQLQNEVCDYFRRGKTFEYIEFKTEIPKPSKANKIKKLFIEEHISETLKRIGAK